MRVKESQGRSETKVASDEAYDTLSKCCSYERCQLLALGRMCAPIFSRKRKGRYKSREGGKSDLGPGSKTLQDA